MNTTDFNGKQYTMQDNGDGSITLVPVKAQSADGDFDPEVTGEDYFKVDGEGVVIQLSWDDDPVDFDAKAFHNIFPREAQAKKAAEYMRRSNASIRACLLVDPDFVPDWKKDGDRWYPLFSHYTNEWTVTSTNRYQGEPAYVSTKQKCEQVCALLTKWGVK